MTSKYGFETAEYKKMLQDLVIEYCKEEAIRICPIIKDVLEDYKNAHEIPFEVHASIIENPNYPCHFAGWSLKHYQISFCCSDNYKSISLSMGFGGPDSYFSQDQLLRSVILKQIGYDNANSHAEIENGKLVLSFRE